MKGGLCAALILASITISGLALADVGCFGFIKYHGEAPNVVIYPLQCEGDCEEGADEECEKLLVVGDEYACGCGGVTEPCFLVSDQTPGQAPEFECRPLGCGQSCAVDYFAFQLGKLPVTHVFCECGQP